MFTLGLALLTGVSLLDYRQLRLYSPIVLGISCLGLLVVLTPFGTIVNGAKSWISLPGGFQIEPSEYAGSGLGKCKSTGAANALRRSGDECGSSFKG